MIKCIETGVIYPSISQASKQTGIKRQSISMCVNGKRKKANGFTFVKSDTLQHIKCDSATDEKVNDNNENSKVVLHATDEKSDTLQHDITDFKNIIDMMVNDFIAYRERTVKLRNEYQKLKAEYEALKNQPQSNDELQAEFDKILEEKRAKFENLVHLYKNVCNERDGLSERIRIIINAPEYKSFRNRERREGNERAKKDKEEWNIVDDTDDEFSAFGTFPERKQTQKHYDDDIGF